LQACGFEPIAWNIRWTDATAFSRFDFKTPSPYSTRIRSCSSMNFSASFFAWSFDTLTSSCNLNFGMRIILFDNVFGEAGCPILRSWFFGGQMVIEFLADCDSVLYRSYHVASPEGTLPYLAPC
jgi:hypothetical protein